MEEPKSPLHVPHTPRKRGVNPVRCCIGIVIFLGVLVSLAIAAAIFMFARSVIGALRDPHKVVFAPSNPSNLTGTVRPLIGKDDTFDLVLGIWVREPLEKLEGLLDIDKELELVEGDESWTPSTARKQVSLDERLDIRNDRNIYEETIFRNVRMDRKVLDTTAHFDLPTDILHDRLLFATDIRATLTVIPNYIDLEGIGNYSDWRPAAAGPFARLSDKYKTSNARRNPLEWEALEHMAISHHPLMLYNDDDCVKKVKKVHWTMPEGHDNWAFPPSNMLTDQIAINNALTWKPYMYTRSHFYMIQESRNVSEEVYNKHHHELRRTSCGQNLHPPKPSRWYCSREYEKHGNWETLLDLGAEDGQRDLRYAPYLGVLNKAAGPRDLVRLMGTRPLCRNATTPIEELPKTIPIDFHIRFSTLSPARVKVLDNIMPTDQINITATDRETRIGHDSWELVNGLFGNTMHGTRPYTRFCLALFNDFIFPLSNIILTFLYWATRQTTAGISLPAVWCLALSLFVDIGRLAKDAYDDADNHFLIAFQAMVACWVVAQLYFLLRLIFPYDIAWTGRTISVERKEWSHRERASKRIDTGPWPLWIGAVCLLWLVQYLSATDRLHIIRSVLPPVPPTKYHEVITGSLVDALYAMRIALQLVHNHKSQSFAGTYHLVAGLSLAQTIGQMMYHVPAVVGRYEVGQGLGLDMVVRLGLELARVWQGYKWSRVEQVVQEDDE